MAKHFVTGGAGFIGSHLVERLTAEGNKVTIYDNLFSGNRDNIQAPIGERSINLVISDLLDFKILKREMKGHDVIWHLGANTDIPGGNINTDLDLKNCTIATHNVLEAMRQNEINQILFASSACVFGDTPPVALNENYGPLLPINLYGAGKLACEGLISAYCHLFSMQAWIFRFGNVVGARANYGIIRDFILKLRQNPKELEILGDGTQEKNYFLIEDCIGGILCAFHNSNEPCNVFNLGCDSIVKVATIAQIVIEEIGLKNVKIKYTGGKRGWPGDVPIVNYDLSKIHKLGWKAKNTSEEAMRIATKRLLEEDGFRGKIEHEARH